jgi:hypothetical protein
VGRIPLAQGWKVVYGASEPDAAGDETEQTLPPLTDGEMARLTEPRIDAKRTQAPPRYNGLEPTVVSPGAIWGSWAARVAGSHGAKTRKLGSFCIRYFAP